MVLLSTMYKPQNLAIRNPSPQGPQRVLEASLSFIHPHKGHGEKEGPECLKQSPSMLSYWNTASLNFHSGLLQLRRNVKG